MQFQLRYPPHEHVRIINFQVLVCSTWCSSEISVFATRLCSHCNTFFEGLACSMYQFDSRIARTWWLGELMISCNRGRWIIDDRKRHLALNFRSSYKQNISRENSRGCLLYSSCGESRWQQHWEKLVWGQSFHLPGKVTTVSYIDESTYGEITSCFTVSYPTYRPRAHQPTISPSKRCIRVEGCGCGAESWWLKVRHFGGGGIPHQNYFLALFTFGIIGRLLNWIGRSDG